MESSDASTEFPVEESAYETAREARFKKRAQLMARLEEEEADDLIARLNKCGKLIPLVCTGCGDKRNGVTRCDLKWCPSCSHALAARTAQKYRALAELAAFPLFVTFTTKNYDAPNVRPFRRAWGKLRRLRWFRRCAIGGVVGFEATNKGKGWHWHAHGLIDCEWLAVSVPKPGFVNAEKWKARAKAACNEVGEQWSLCTGRPSSVCVRRIWKRGPDDINDACREVLKYAVTAESLLECPEPIAPALRLLDGTRLVTSFGTFFGKAPKRERKAPLMCKCGCSDAIPEFLVDSMVRKSRPKNSRVRS